MEEAEIEKLSRDYQAVQEQVQALEMQREQFTLQKDEYAEAQAELERATGKVYMFVGGVMLEVAREKATADIKERQELIGARLSAVTKQYDESLKKSKTLRDKLAAALNLPDQQ